MRHPANAGNAHDGNFQHFHIARQAAFLDLFSDLAGRGGKQQVRQDEQAANQRRLKFIAIIFLQCECHKNIAFDSETDTMTRNLTLQISLGTKWKISIFPE
jgi:hypothetical protein